MPALLFPLLGFLSSKAGIAVLVGGIAFASGYRAADRSAELRHAQAQLEIQRGQVEVAERINREQAEIARAEYEAVDHDRTKLKELLDAQRKHPQVDRRCLDRGTARRLRSL